MRVTESRLMSLSADGVSQARDRLAKAQGVMSSGMRVENPSDDPAAWAEGARAAAGQKLTASHGRALGRARDALSLEDQALGTFEDVLARLQETTIQGATDTLTAEDRGRLAELARTLGRSALSAANTRGPDGEFLFAGTKGDKEAFDPTTATPAFQGDALERLLDLGGTQGAVTVSGANLTTAMPLFERIAVALETNDVAGLRAALPEIKTAIGTVAGVRTNVGARMEALDKADQDRQAFELQLAQAHARAVEADPITAASDLARTASALESARAAAEAVLASIRNR